MYSVIPPEPIARNEPSTWHNLCIIARTEPPTFPYIVLHPDGAPYQQLHSSQRRAPAPCLRALPFAGARCQLGSVFPLLPLPRYPERSERFLDRSNTIPHYHTAIFAYPMIVQRYDLIGFS
jgi:hypothetical protein